MSDPLSEARLVGSIDQHEQITINNSTGAALSPNEIFAITNASGNTIPCMSRATIAADADGEALIVGEIDVAKATGGIFAAGDDVYWHTSANEAVTRANAKTGDFFLGRCTLAAATGATFVRLRLDDGLTADVISTSSSISQSVCSSSVSVASVSSSSKSVDATSVSSLSTSSTLSQSSNSDSSTSSAISVSSNSDSSTSISA